MPLEFKDEVVPTSQIELAKLKGKLKVKNTRMRLPYGWLGRAFGEKQNAPTNILGFLVVFIAAAMAFDVLFRGGSIEGYVQMLIGLFGGTMGYMAGKHFKE